MTQDQIDPLQIADERDVGGRMIELDEWLAANPARSFTLRRGPRTTIRGACIVEITTSTGQRVEGGSMGLGDSLFDTLAAAKRLDP